MTKKMCQIMSCEREAMCWVPRGIYGTILCFEHTMELVERLCPTENIMACPIGWILPILGLGDESAWEREYEPLEDSQY